MNDQHKEPGYLLDDEDFHRVMQQEHARAGKADDQLTRQRIWQRLEKSQRGRKASRAWVYQLTVLAATVLLVLFVGPLLQKSKEPELVPSPKAGLENRSLSFELQNLQGQRLSYLDEVVSDDASVKVRSDEPRFVAIYGETLAGKRELIHAATPIEAQREQSFTLGAVANYKRICLMTAGTRDELKRMEDLLDLVWDQLSDQQCLIRR
jgi:hypothetical protein